MAVHPIPNNRKFQSTMSHTVLIPKVTIVTPSYNQGQYLEATLRSVLDQGYPNLEYIVIDGGSTDNSVDIIQRYADHLTYWVSEPDGGMYDALNKGFSRATGELMGWLNSDDMHCPWTLQTVSDIFGGLPELDWLTTRTQLEWNTLGQPVDANRVDLYARSWFYRGWFLGNQPGFKYWIQQESTFWRRGLWERAGSRLDASLHYAGDFELWARFWEHAHLAVTNVPLAGWRRQPAQKTTQMDRYYAEAEKVLAPYRRRTLHNPLVIWLLEQLLRWTGRGGQRFGSRLSQVKYAKRPGEWAYSYRHCI